MWQTAKERGMEIRGGEFLGNEGLYGLVGCFCMVGGWQNGVVEEKVCRRVTLEQVGVCSKGWVGLEQKQKREGGGHNFSNCRPRRRLSTVAALQCGRASRCNPAALLLHVTCVEQAKQGRSKKIELYFVCNAHML